MDTAGQEDYDRLRPLSYPQADIVLCCFSVDSAQSAENIVDKWVPEVKHFIPRIPILLVATKSDLRTDEKTIARLRRTRSSLVTTEEGQKLAQQIGAIKYFECSAKENQNLTEIFEEAVRIAVAARGGCCTLL